MDDRVTRAFPLFAYVTILYVRYEVSKELHMVLTDRYWKDLKKLLE